MTVDTLILDAGAAQVTWRFRRGDTASIVVPVINQSGNPVDVSGWTFTCQLRADPDAAAVLAAATVDMSDAATGRFTVTVGAATTAGLPDTAVYDVQCDNGSTVRTWFGGPVVVERDVTR